MGDFDKNYSDYILTIYHDSLWKMREIQSEKKTELPKGAHDAPSEMSFKELMESLKNV